MGIWANITGLFRKKEEQLKVARKPGELNLLIDLESRVHHLSLECEAFQKTYYRKGSHPGIVDQRKFYLEILVPYLKILKWIYNRLPYDQQKVDGVFLVEKNQLIKVQAFGDRIRDLKGKELDQEILQQCHRLQ